MSVQHHVMLEFAVINFVFGQVHSLLKLVWEMRTLQLVAISPRIH